MIRDTWHNRYLTGTHLRSILKARSHLLSPFLHLTRQSHAADSGEASEFMPGGIADISLQPYLTGHPSIAKHSERMERLCFLVFDSVEVSTHNSIHGPSLSAYIFLCTFHRFAFCSPQCNAVPQLVLRLRPHVPTHTSVRGTVQIWGYLFLPIVASISGHTNG